MLISLWQVRPELLTVSVCLFQSSFFAADVSMGTAVHRTSAPTVVETISSPATSCVNNRVSEKARLST